MSFIEYRKESATLYQYIYSFFLAFTKSPSFYFDKCFEFIGEEANGKLGKGTELALFCITAPIESMITEVDSEYICKLTDFMIKKGTNIYPRIAVQALMLINHGTRELKSNTSLCLNALDYSLFYLLDDKVCFYAAEAFKAVMEVLTTASDEQLVSKLIHYYSTQSLSS
jgi:hypothetical protein